MAARVAPLLPVEALSEPPAERQGRCRICFEEGSPSRRLIKPCLCDGYSKWVHEGCLERWRATGGTAMTHCRECTTAYQLGVRRVRGAQFPWRRFAKTGVVGLTVVQLLMFCLGLVIRAIDQHEWLVRFFHFPQRPGHGEPGSFLDAIRHHKTTYYVASILTLLGVLGVAWVMVMPVVWVRAGFRPRVEEEDVHCLVCQGCCWTTCGVQVFLGTAATGLLVVSASFVAMGLFASIVVFVHLCLHVALEFAQHQARFLLAREYFVMDQAAATDLGVPESPVADAPQLARSFSNPPVLDVNERVQQATLVSQLTRELSGISRDSASFYSPRSVSSN